MAPLHFEPLHEWHACGQVFPADGLVKVAKPSKELVRLAHHAHAAGAIVIADECLQDLAKHGVETQEASEAKLVEAQGEWVRHTTRADGTTEPGYWTGPWVEGHLLNVRKPGHIDVPIDAESAGEEG